MYTYRLCLYLCLVSATVTEITSTARCTTKIVHVIWTTISHFDTCCVIIAVVTTSKIHLPGDLTVRYWGMSSTYPARIIGTTPIGRWTWCCHSCAGRPLETEPSRTKTAITIRVVPAIRSPSASAVETPVVLTFWHKRGERTSVASNVSFSCTSARSPHIREPKTVLDSGFHAVNYGSNSRYWIPVFVSGTLDYGFKS